MSEEKTKSPGLFDIFFRFIESKKPSDKFLFLGALIVFLSSIIALVLLFNATTLTNTPGKGGTFREGVVGTARFINPALALTRTDQDLTSLVYSGLMRIAEDGSLENDLAESVTISDDGLVYNVVLKPGLRFHDNSPLTTTDIEYTVELLQNAELKSPLAGHWNGVSTEIISPTEMNFILSEPYSPFIENLTIGIMPKQVWSSFSMEELPFGVSNTEAVGSGPYRVSEIIRSKRGSIERITLTAYNGNGYTPHISTFEFYFFETTNTLKEALLNGSIDATIALGNETLSELKDDDRFTLHRYPLPRNFGLFPNQNRSIALRDTEARKAISTLIDRQSLIDEVLYGFGTEEMTPVPSAFLNKANTTNTRTQEERQAEATQLLEGGGWSKNENGGWSKNIDGDDVALSFTISTINNELFSQAALFLKQQFATIDIPVDIAQYEQADFLQSVVRTRDYELLLTGNDLGRGLDLFQFWHSSQRESQLNAALYTNLDADVYLTRYRSAATVEERQTELSGFLEEFTNDMPAIFLASPDAVYAVRSGITITPTARVSRPHERFSTVTKWHTSTERLWPFVE